MIEMKLGVHNCDTTGVLSDVITRVVMVIMRLGL